MRVTGQLLCRFWSSSTVYRQVFFYILIVFPASSYAQKCRFNLIDPNPKTGCKFTTWQIVYADKDDETCEPESDQMLDSIAWFMNKNKRVVVEVQDHRQAGSSSQHSMRGAENVVDK